jgi:hypothetical protein
MVQASLAGDAVNQSPVGVEEILPALLVTPVLEPRQQALAGRNPFFALAGSLHRALGQYAVGALFLAGTIRIPGGAASLAGRQKWVAA